jgi:RHS repeat-associated protein
VPDENPSGLGAFEFPLRFPGQYADKETNLYYNYFRDYDSASGRYVESDPIGLDGGINTYAYVGSAPLKLVDPRGLDATVVFYGGGVTHIGIGINTSNTVGLYPVLKTFSACKDVPGAILNDPTFQTNASSIKSLTIKTTLEQDWLMQQYLNKMQQGGVPATYNLCSLQCSTFVMNVLKAGGIVIPDDDIVLPSRLFGSLTKAYGRSGGAK